MEKEERTFQVRFNTGDGQKMKKAAYIKSWASRIRQEQGILYEAIQMAQRSCDLIMGTEVKA